MEFDPGRVSVFVVLVRPPVFYRQDGTHDSPQTRTAPRQKPSPHGGVDGNRAKGLLGFVNTVTNLHASMATVPGTRAAVKRNQNSLNSGRLVI